MRVSSDLLGHFVRCNLIGDDVHKIFDSHSNIIENMPNIVVIFVPADGLV